MSTEPTTKKKQAIDAPRGATTYWLDPWKVTIIGLDTHDGAEHYLFDERIKLPLDPIKVKGVQANGVEQPVRVVSSGGQLIAEDGRQRVRWARKANELNRAEPGDGRYILVPAIVARGDDVDHLRRMVRSNEHRESDTPYMKAKKAERLISMGVPIEQVANEFAVSKQTLKSYLELLDLAPDVQRELAAGKVTAAEALRVKDAPPDRQGAELRGWKDAAKGPGKRRSESTKPTRNAIEAMIVLAIGQDEIQIGSHAIARVLQWSLGLLNSDGLRAHPGMLKLFEGAAKKRAATIKP